MKLSDLHRCFRRQHAHARCVEEKILALQQRKAELANAGLEGGRSTKLRFSEGDLAELFAPLK